MTKNFTSSGHPKQIMTWKNFKFCKKKYLQNTTDLIQAYFRKQLHNIATTKKLLCNPSSVEKPNSCGLTLTSHLDSIFIQIILRQRMEYHVQLESISLKEATNLVNALKKCKEQQISSNSKLVFF